ncbi:protein-disulfide reductase DsbD family protein [Klebsiella pneumoniae]
MYMVFRRLLVCLLWLWLPVSQAADSGWLRAADNQHASVRLRAQTESNGDTRLLLDVALEKGWKTYWRSPGEGGIAPAIAWHTPLEVNWRWPTPQRFDVAGISTQGYHGDVSFPMTLRGKIPPTLSGVLTLSTCSNVCILTDYPFSLDMTTPAGERFNYDFTRAMGTLPLRDGLTSQLTASYVSGKLTVTARRDAGWQQPALFIDSMEDVDFGKPSFTTRSDTLTATVPVTDSWGEAAPDLRGKTLSLVLADSGQAQESQVAVAAGSAAPGLALGWVLLMALAGGLILNVMPCVLPVLAMKLGSLVQTEGRERGAVRRQFLASVFGIVVSFLALALMSVALVAPLPLLWGIFFAMGIGMSLPWLLIVAWPGLAQRLPRPGRWMNHLRVVLGLMMLGSALWLVSLLTIHIGRTPVLTLLVMLAIALLVATAWRYRWRTALRAGALAIVVAGAVAFVAQQDGQGPRRDRVNWQPLSEQAIASALAEHKRVFIDVTADWCVTCKANKYNVLLRDDVQQALLAPDVIALRGDWSRPSADISQFLTARGSAAVPFNQIYGPELPQGQILPALLDREHLLATLSAAKGK